ncbi:MAG TPA: ATP-binding protein [Terracidiphilus sp.]|jgi:signal transduction histidine kinase
MSLRQKLLLLFSITVAAAVVAVAWTVLLRIKLVFEQRDQQDTALVVSQFQREFQHRSVELGSAVDRLAASEHVRNMAFEIVQSGDSSPYLTEAQTLAQQAQLDFLEIVGPDGNVVSSAQWPARFGYPEPAGNFTASAPFLKREELPDGSTVLGLFAVRAVRSAEPAVRLIGGKRLDPSFLADLPTATGMQVCLYSDAGLNGDASTGPSANSGLPSAFDARRLLGANGEVTGAQKYQPLIEETIKTGQQASGILYLTNQRMDSVAATAIPLKSETGSVLAVLTVSISRAGMVQAQQHIRAIAYGIATAGILIAIAVSLWIAARVSRPIEQLAHAAEDVAGGHWEVQVPERGNDEVGILARSFNHMTSELSSQRERLIQTERVAAWRELARRLAHELKNPLFPLQLTVENLVRSRALSPEEFDEVFRESTQTLGMEIANLKAIIGRFSDFSKMPKPELERIDARDVVARVRALYDTGAHNGSATRFEVEIADVPMPLRVDPELLHRALSNLVLNAMDAMPEGGTIRLSARPSGNQLELRVTDTGQGLTPEECARLFTPYYTTKQHGTGLGLAIVQSVVADHEGKITVESRVGEGATFVITLPRADA